MNELYQQEFINQALKSGVPREKVASLLARATEIANRQVKTASKNIDLVGELLQNAGLEKSASSVSYVHGILNEAFTSGANLPQALSITKQALDATAKKAIFMEKVSAIAGNPQLSQYAEGFLASAKTAGLSHDESLSLLVDLVDREKQAGGDEMFKQSPGAGAGPAPTGAPDSDPSAGSPPGGGGAAPSPEGDPSGGQGAPGASDPQEAQILQMLASLPPQEQQQIIQQLLAAISGGQGGPGGPGAGGPPPMAAGPGGPGGAPQPGGPQGPA